MKLYCHLVSNPIELEPKRKNKPAKVVTSADALTCTGIKKGVCEVKKRGRGNHKPFYVPLTFVEFYAKVGSNWIIFPQDVRQTV